MISYLTNKIYNHKTEIWAHGLATLAAVVSRLSTLFITLINTQFFLPAEFGVFAVLILTTNIVNAFVSCGGDMWLNRFSRHRHARFLRAPIVSRFYLQISGGLAGLVVLVALWFMTFGKHTFHEHGLAVAFALLWAASAGMIEAVLAILRTTNDIHRFFIIRDLCMPVVLIGSLVFLKMNTCLQFFLTAFLLWLGVLILLLRFILKRSSLYMPLSSWSWQFLRKGLISYTVGLVMNNFTARLVNSFDTLILARSLPIELVGKYRLVAHFSNAFTVVQHFVFLALPWHLRERTESMHDSKRLRTVRIRQALLVASATPPLLVFVLLAKPLLGMLGEGFQAMTPLFVIFLLIRFSELLWGPQHEKLISNNRVTQDTVANIMGILVGITILVVSMNFFSLISSAVVASGVSSIIVQGIRYFFLRSQRQPSQAFNRQPILWVSIVITLFSIGYTIQSELVK